MWKDSQTEASTTFNSSVLTSDFWSKVIRHTNRASLSVPGQCCLFPTRVCTANWIAADSSFIHSPHSVLVTLAATSDIHVLQFWLTSSWSFREMIVLSVWRRFSVLFLGLYLYCKVSIHYLNTSQSVLWVEDYMSLQSFLSGILGSCCWIIISLKTGFRRFLMHEAMYTVSNALVKSCKILAMHSSMTQHLLLYIIQILFCYCNVVYFNNIISYLLL